MAILNERDLAFLLYEFLDTEALLARSRYADLSREVFDATLATARRIAEERFAPHLARGDAQEPTFDGASVTLVAETKAAWDALASAGFLNAHWDAGEGVPGVLGFGNQRDRRAVEARLVGVALGDVRREQVLGELARGLQRGVEDLARQVGIPLAGQQ